MLNAQTVEIDYFEKPTQVAYFNPETEEFTGGIGYGSKIIDMVNGNVIDIQDLYEPYVLNIESQPVVVFAHWINLSEEVIGDAFE